MSLVAGAQTLPPRYDHVVVVVLENINGNEIIGNTTGAPYLANLAAQGAYLSTDIGMIHTSAPNYGELFAGADNGITDNAILPAPLTTPNLGAELRQKGYTFSGYAQSMPSIGYTGLASGAYVRGHNPWVNWQNDSPSATANQLPSSINLPFTLFPSNAAGFAQLPTVSFITPDNDHNMHNGTTLAQRLSNGDNFVKNSLDGYVQWAKANNSLLIVTADEDDRDAGSGNYNQVPAIFAGANIRPGAVVAQPYTLHDTLRTIEDMYALPHAAAANTARPVTGAFVGDPTVNLKTFQNGTGGYTGGHDTQIRADTPTTAYGTTTPLTADLDTAATSGNQPAEALIRFDTISGAAAGQIPADATVLSAKLKLWSTNIGSSIHLHRMLAAWTESSTWTSMGSGILTNDVQAASVADFTYAPKTANEPFYFDVSNSVQSWIDGAPNYGWVILSSGADDYQFNASEAGTVGARPELDVAYALYPRFTGAGGSWNTAGNWTNGMPGGAGTVARFLSRAAPAAVTMDGDKTVGSIIFDSAGAYTINAGSGGVLTLANYGNVASIALKQGQHTLAVPIDLADPTSIDIAAGGQLNVTGAVTLAAGKVMTKTGAGVLNLTGPLVMKSGSSAVVSAGELRALSITGGGLTVGTGAVVKLSGSGASGLSSLMLDGAAKLDLGGGGLVLDYSDSSVLTTTLAQIKSARGAGWMGNGIGSSSAAANSRAAIGVGEAADVLHLASGETDMFLGQQVDATALLVRYTLLGDANLDGAVNFADLVQVAQHYGAPGGWSTGDFDYDGSVNFTDLVGLAQNYGEGLPAGAEFGGDFSRDLASVFASVPEPGFLAVGMLAMAGLMRRRRRAVG